MLFVCCVPRYNSRICLFVQPLLSVSPGLRHFIPLSRTSRFTLAGLTAPPCNLFILSASSGLRRCAPLSPASRRAPCNPRLAKRLMLRIFYPNSRKPSTEQARFGFGHLDKPPSGNIRFSGLDCGGKGIRTLDTLLRYTHFPGVLLRPLGHSSNLKITLSNELSPDLITNRLRLLPFPFRTFVRRCQKPFLRVKVRINIYCAQHPDKFHRFRIPPPHGNQRVISPRIGVWR